MAGPPQRSKRDFRRSMEFIIRLTKRTVSGGVVGQPTRGRYTKAKGGGPERIAKLLVSPRRRNLGSVRIQMV